MTTKIIKVKASKRGGKIVKAHTRTLKSLGGSPKGVSFSDFKKSDDAWAKKNPNLAKERDIKIARQQIADYIKQDKTKKRTGKGYSVKGHLQKWRKKLNILLKSR
jgi:hypothetical protein